MLLRGGKGIQETSPPLWRGFFSGDVLGFSADPGGEKNGDLTGAFMGFLIMEALPLDCCTRFTGVGVNS